MRTMVTGGAGYIGSVVADELLRQGHEVVVFDNLAKGHPESVPDGAAFVRGELADGDAVRTALRAHRVEAVVHMAADSLVGESVQKPGKYYRNNVAAGIELLEAMRECQVGMLVFSSTAAVYGNPVKQPIEEHDPLMPTNTYGETKLAFERALRWYSEAHGLRHVSLRYFNAAGASGRFGERHDPETHLIPLVLRVAAGSAEDVVIFGNDYPTSDGTCVRDYIHVVDLAAAHVLALAALATAGPPPSAVFNVGCGGAGYTVRSVIDTAQEVTGRPIRSRVGARRAGDPAVLIASPAKIQQELGWRAARQDLRVIIESAWEWMQSRHLITKTR